MLFNSILLATLQSFLFHICTHTHTCLYSHPSKPLLLCSGAIYLYIPNVLKIGFHYFLYFYVSEFRESSPTMVNCYATLWTSSILPKSQDSWLKRTNSRSMYQIFVAFRDPSTSFLFLFFKR